MIKLRNEIYKTIDILVEERIKRLKFNYMITGTITEVLNVNTYKVDLFDNIETLKSMNGQEYLVGDIIYVVVWNNNYSDKTIVCKATR